MRAARAAVAVVAALAVASACAADPAGTGPVEGPQRAAVFDGEPEEWFRAQARCLDEAGWRAEVGPEGRSLSMDEVPPGERQELQRAVDDCRRRLGSLPTTELDAAGIESLYTALLETRDCLAREGYAMGAAPTLEEFAASWDTEPWHPYRELPPVDGEEWDRLNRACPQPAG